jgi:hypothetical protein
MGLRIPQLLGMILAGMVISGAPASAQSGAIDGPTLGYVYDGRSSGLKPLVGIPGAAVLGTQLDAGTQIRKAYVSPRQNYAVALTDSDTLLVAFRSATDAPDVVPLGFPATAAAIAALSSDGSSAAFYSADEALIRIVTGLPGAPAVARSVPTAAVSGTIRLLAIGNDGSQLVAVVDADAAPDSAIALDADGNPRTLANSTHISAVQFSANDLLVADDMDDTVSMVQDAPGSALWRPLAAAADGIAGPTGLDVSLDGRLVIVANGRAGNIFVFDPNGPQRGAYACPCTPAGLGRLNGNSVFLLNSISDGGPLWIFDGDSVAPRVMFIPADQSGPAGVVR